MFLSKKAEKWYNDCHEKRIEQIFCESIKVVGKR